MQSKIYDKKNGLTYTLCGDYYIPELTLTDTEPTYGKYGMLRKRYLQEHRKAKYQILLLQSGCHLLSFNDSRISFASSLISFRNTA